jgi:hypothetical protein
MNTVASRSQAPSDARGIDSVIHDHPGPGDSRVDAFVLYQASPATYGLRLMACSPSRLRLSDGKPSALGFADYRELAALRQAQAWGAPVFQPSHARYRQVLARFQELEARERAATG